MNDLIAKLEDATEGSRELDAEIGQIVAFEETDCYVDNDKPGYIRIPGCGSISSQSVPCRHYTTSTDAALPDENIVEMAMYDVVEGEPLGCFYRVRHVDENGKSFEGEHRIEAIARRIAALRARIDMYGG